MNTEYAEVNKSMISSISMQSYFNERQMLNVYQLKINSNDKNWLTLYFSRSNSVYLG